MRMLVPMSGDKMGAACKGHEGGLDTQNMGVKELGGGKDLKVLHTYLPSA